MHAVHGFAPGAPGCYWGLPPVGRTYLRLRLLSHWLPGLLSALRSLGWAGWGVGELLTSLYALCLFYYFLPFPLYLTAFPLPCFSIYGYFCFMPLLILFFSGGLYYMHCNYIRVGFPTWRICARLSYIRRCALAAPCWPPPSPIDLIFDKLTAFNRSSSSSMCRPLLILLQCMTAFRLMFFGS